MWREDAKWKVFLGRAHHAFLCCPPINIKDTTLPLCHETESHRQHFRAAVNWSAPSVLNHVYQRLISVGGKPATATSTSLLLLRIWHSDDDNPFRKMFKDHKDAVPTAEDVDHSNP